MNNRNPQGTLGGALKYWKGQKRHIQNGNDEGSFDYKLNGNPTNAPDDDNKIIKPTPNHLNKLTRLMAVRELRLFKAIGNISPKKDMYAEMRNYFNGTAQKSAFMCLAYKCYFDGLYITTGMATHQLQINRSSALMIIKHCQKKEWLTEFQSYKYRVEPIIYDFWHNYMHDLITNNTELFRKINVLAEAYLLDKDDGLPID
jgi:hypothetical protein